MSFSKWAVGFEDASAAKGRVPPPPGYDPNSSYEEVCCSSPDASLSNPATSTLSPQLPLGVFQAPKDNSIMNKRMQEVLRIKPLALENRSPVQLIRE